MQSAAPAASDVQVHNAYVATAPITTAPIYTAPASHEIPLAPAGHTVPHAAVHGLGIVTDAQA
jgi:hypothetical protein